MDLKHISSNIKLPNKVSVYALFSAGFVLITAVTAFIVFFLVVRGPEQTMVPNVVGKDIIEALLEMQQKELYPRIQLRFSTSAAEKNKILEQEPRQGTIVKAGRRIRLVVSQGVQVSRIDSYVGQMVSDVRAELLTIASGAAEPLLSIQEPLEYEASAKPAGTILEQTPPAGTGISGPTALRFTVSRGRNENITMPALIGLTLKEASEEIAKSGVQAVFSIQKAEARRTGETVVSQNPAGGVDIPVDRKAEIVIAAPANLANDEVFILFEHELSPSAFPIPVKLEAIPPSSSTPIKLAELNHAGGRFTYPCRVKRGSELVLSVLGAEVHRVAAQ
ncbi:MAG: PASTA domain-containing protein [Spirochaetaceae bacterium]|jgi:beta-lactam-binding protein with PASTA domain|nr:PASTA domain-containing protein [Spirochaetaceae bacterium]